MNLKKKIEHGIQARRDLSDPAKLVNSSILSERRRHCLKCPFRRFGICMKCKCPTHDKTKLKDEECPAGKWGKVK